MNKTKLLVNEIFFSIQGEGANTGMPAVFIRLSGCNLKCDFCDTKHDTYNEMTVAEVKAEVEKYKCLNIIWTGGEPTLQLTTEILSYFSDYRNCLETNGTRQVSHLINYLACSPKDGAKITQKIGFAHEIRIPIKKGDRLPDLSTLPEADNYYVSPIDVSKENIDYCMELVKQNQRWKLSIQLHKLLNIR
jgi:organic radical activating enzyme